MTEELWTGSQKKAWAYVSSGVDRGLSQTEALKQYRNGGGAIRTSSWVELWHRAQEGVDNWNTLYQYKGADQVSESLFVQTGINFKEKYVMSFTTDIRSPDGSILHNIQRQVESAHRLTLDDWISAATESLEEDLSNPAVEVTGVRDIRFYKKGE